MQSVRAAPLDLSTRKPEALHLQLLVSLLCTHIWRILSGIIACGIVNSFLAVYVRGFNIYVCVRCVSVCCVNGASGV